MKTDEIEKLAEKHGGTVIDYSLPEGPQTMDTTIIIATSELASLIAEVRRETREEAARICEDNATGDDSPWHTMGCNECADLIRARLGSPMGKEERK